MVNDGTMMAGRDVGSVVAQLLLYIVGRCIGMYTRAHTGGVTCR